MTFRLALGLSAWMFSILAFSFECSAAPDAAPARPLSRLVRELIQSPDSPVLHYELGLAYYRHGVWLQAEKELWAAMHISRKIRPAGISDADLVKAYLRAVRAQRPLTAELKFLQDLRRLSPSDAEAARWLVEVYLDKGDGSSARAVMAAHPALKQNADILAKWVSTQSPGSREGIADQEERFRNLVTLMDIGSASHKTTAARQLLDLAGRMPVSTVTIDRQKSVDRAFERIKSDLGAAPDPDESLKIHDRYLAVLDQWKNRAKAKSLIQDMRKKFDSARTNPALVYRLAKHQAADRQIEEALVSIREAFRLGVEEGQAHLVYADLLDRKGKTLEAIGEYLSALEGTLPAPDRSQAEEQVEKWLAHVDPLQSSSAVLVQRAAGLMNRSSRAQILWAGRLEARGETQKAYERYLAAAGLDQRSRAAREGVARTAIALGRASDIDAALQHLDVGQVRLLWKRWQILPIGRRLLALGDTSAGPDDTKLKQDPGPARNEEAAVEEAILIRAEGDPEKAIEILMRLDRKSKAACRLLSNLFADRNRWEMAAGWMEKAVETEQDKMLAAWYWFRSGQSDEAFRYVPPGSLFEAVLDAERGRFQKLEKQNPALLRTVLGEAAERPEPKRRIRDDWTESVLAAAKRRAAAGDDEAVLKMCDEILRREPVPEALYMKGTTYLKLGLYDDAKRALEKAAQSKDWSVPANLKLGQLSLIRDRPDEALLYLDHAGPGSDPAELILAWGMALALTKSPEQGEQIVRQVSSKSARGKFFLARLLEKQGRTREALDIYKSTVREYDLFSPARYRLGLLALSARDSQTAESAFAAILQRSRESDPYFRMAAQKLEDARRLTGRRSAP